MEKMDFDPNNVAHQRARAVVERQVLQRLREARKQVDDLVVQLDRLANYQITFDRHYPVSKENCQYPTHYMAIMDDKWAPTVGFLVNLEKVL